MPRKEIIVTEDASAVNPAEAPAPTQASPKPAAKKPAARKQASAPAKPSATQTDAATAKPAAKAPAKKVAERKPASAAVKPSATPTDAVTAKPAAKAPAKKPAAKATTKQPAAKKPATRKPAPAAAPAQAALAPEVRESLDADISALQLGARVWSTLSVRQRATLMRRVRDGVAAQAEAWANAAARSKGLDEDHPLVGEEWLSGPYATLAALGTYERTLKLIAAGKSPLDGVKTSHTPSGQLTASVFPADAVDATLLNGFTGQVWFTPGTTLEQATHDAGLAQLRPAESGGVGLVLGAGNVTSIPVLDVIYELLAANRVVLLKVNPTQNSLVPIFKRALAALIEPGFLRIVEGAGDVGGYLTQHESIDHVHITGSAVTFDAIVWGPGAEGAKRKQAATPLLHKPITGELGGVAPIIVVPSKWSQADLEYQAEHIVTMRLQNCGHICISGQVVIVSSDWAQRDDFVAALRRAYAKAPQRVTWYPNSAPKLAAAKESYPTADAFGDRLLVETQPGDDLTPLQTTEYFAPVLGIVTLSGTGQDFLDAAVAHANDQLVGTLGANVLIEPNEQARLGEGFERAIEDLRYGNIAINGWTGFSFTAPTLSWGAFPGHTLDDVGSGIGIVHNGLMLAHVERSVLRGPFRPFPRAIGTRAFTILPKPPWFVTSRTGTQVSEGFTRYRIDGKIGPLLKTLAAALRA